MANLCIKTNWRKDTNYVFLRKQEVHNTPKKSYNKILQFTFIFKKFFTVL